jgi:hypothetical protein
LLPSRLPLCFDRPILRLVGGIVVEFETHREDGNGEKGAR